MGCIFRVAGHHDGLRRVGRRRRAKHVEQPVHVGPEIPLPAQMRGVDGEEEMPGLVSEAAGERRAEDLHHRAEAVALVAAELARAAERRQQPDIVPVRRIRNRRAGPVHHPAFRDRLAGAPGDGDLAEGHRAGRHVQREGPVRPGRGGEADGVGAERGVGAEHRGHLLGRRIGEREADQPFRRRHAGIVAGRAVMVGVAHRDRRRAHLPRLVHGGPHGEHSGRVAEAAAGVDQRQRARLALDADVRLRLDAALLLRLLVPGQHADAVAVDAGEVGLDHDMHGRLDMVARHAPALEDRGDLAAKQSVVDGVHGLSPRSGA